MDSLKNSVYRRRERAAVIAQVRESSGTEHNMKVVCDTVFAQVKERFCKSSHLIAAQLVDCTHFTNSIKSFSSADLECATKIWPKANKVQLATKLKPFL